MYDVIIAGAGPSGSLLAYHLARAGGRVLVVERERLPRYKTCGGGVTPKAAKLIPFDISPVVERTVYDADVSCRLGPSFARSSSQPLVYMTMRSRLDELLAREAQEAGADLLDGVQVIGVTADADRISVSTTKGSFEASFAAACDGANSTVAYSAGIPPAQWSDVALEVECYGLPQAEVDAWARRASVDIGVLPGGYAWVFPKAEHLSIGVGSSMKHAPRLRGYLREFARSRGIKLGDNVRVHGHKIPVRKPSVPYAARRVLLLGDAAGLGDPLSGEGISSALKSAQLAAQALTEDLPKGVSPRARYWDLLERQLIPELNSAAITAKLFPASPKLFYTWMRRSDRVWSYACRLLRGEDSYLTMRRKLGIFGRTHDMFLGWNPLGW